MIHYDDPLSLARRVADAARPLLIGLDVDGVLAPIVRHADEARLTSGVAESVSALADHEELHIAIVSGRSIDGLQRFEFDDRVTLIGSHGMEIHGYPMESLNTQEKDRLSELLALANQAMLRAGDGAWVETKPVSVVLHVREAAPGAGAEALEWLDPQANSVEGAHVKAGSAVLELFTRSGDKGSALTRLGAEVAAATTVFVGDDLTDEEAFAALGTSDITIKVGDAPTIAEHRLRDPDVVRDWLRELSLMIE